MNALTLRRFASLLALVLAAGCGGEDARHVRVELDITNTECTPGAIACWVHLRGSGVVVRSDEHLGEDDLARADEQSMLYAEVVTPDGALAMLEIAYGYPETAIRYREVRDGMLTFRGTIGEPSVEMPPANGYWYEPGRFSFRATDAEGRLRIVKNGRVFPLNPDQVTVRESPGYHDHEETHVVIVANDTSYGYYDHGGCYGDDYDHPDPPETTDPDPIDPPDPPDPVEPDPPAPTEPDPPPVTTEPDPPAPPPPAEGESVYTSVQAEGSSCEGSGESSSDDSGGCDSSESSSDDAGCEDSSSSSSSSSDGCEGGESSSSSSSGCDCEGDAYAAELHPRPVKKNSPAQSTFRLAWPIVLVGLINRRWRAKSRAAT